MTSNNSEVTIRRARLDDYEDILEIGDVYYGKDYLQADYHSYFNNPDIYPVVAEVDGKAIGFYFNHVIDGGLTLMKRAGRVHSSYRGSGVFHKMSEELDRHRTECWPSVKYEVFGTTERADRASKEFQQKGFVEVIRKRILNMRARIKDLQGLDTSESMNPIRKMTQDDVKALFINDDAVKKLIPKGFIFNFFLGFRILESNIKYLVNDTEFIFASVPSTLTSLLATTDCENQSLRNFHDEAIDHIDIMSCAHKVKTEMGLGYEIDIYAADGFDKDVFKAHLIRHFQDFKKSTKDDGLAMITFNFSINEEMLLAQLKDIGIVEVFPTMEKYKVFFIRNL